MNEIGFRKEELVFEGVRRVLSRGTARVLERAGSEIFLFDTVSEAHMIVTGDDGKGRQWLLFHEREFDYDLMVLFSEGLKEYAKQRYHFPREMTCYQSVYLKDAPPVLQTKLSVREASVSDFSFVCGHYDKIGEDEILEVIRRGDMLIGEDGGGIVGFIGEHLEGSMGILEVLPQHRGQGFGADLQRAMIGRTMQRGQIPYCQVETDNAPSIRLQQRLGMTMSDDLLYWLY